MPAMYFSCMYGRGPVGAISRDDNGAMVVNHDRCLRCKMCAIACPLGATLYDYVEDKMVKCDPCGGDPACVKLCPSGAISYQDANAANLLNVKNMLPSSKMSMRRWARLCMDGQEI